MRGWHVQMRFDISDRNYSTVEDNIRRGLSGVAPDLTVSFRKGRLRKADGDRRWLTMVMTVDADSAPAAERRAVHWLRRGVPTFQSYPPFIQAKELR